ncbi:MAG: nucleotide exchange factor GrpE [Anaerohalosphaeraceae bacterium]|nr:nucleotide exchange factor GrpE [Anaerohalosphaeraceae bacterium]
MTEKPKKNKKHKAQNEVKDSKPRKKTDALETVTAEKDELFAKLQRLSAEFVNYQKRSAKQVSDAINYEKETVIKSLLPILDNLDHTICGAENTDSSDDMIKAVKIIYDQMLSILKTHGIEQVVSVGQKFDPAANEAMMQKTEPDVEDGIVLEEFQKSYSLGDRIIRPGKVIVNKNSEQKQASDEQ